MFDFNNQLSSDVPDGTFFASLYFVDDTNTVTFSPIQGGRLAGAGTLSGSAKVNGQLEPGLTPGTLTLTGNYTQDTNGTAVIEIQGPTPGTDHDVVAIGGSATLDGALSVSFSGFTPATNDMYTVMTWSSQSGTFSTTNVTGLPAGLDMDVIYDAAGLILTVVEGPSGINSFTSIVADEQPAGSAQGPGDTREEQESVTGVVLHWEADAGQSFNLEMTHDMTEWISIPAVIEEITPGHYRTVVELPAEPQQCFFRFVRSP